MANTNYGANAFPKDLAAKYELVNWVGGHIQNFGQYGTIDLSKLTEHKVESLIHRGFKRIRRIEKTSTSNSDKSKK